MGHLVDTPSLAVGAKSHQRRIPDSPFYSRAYGGYTGDQERFYLEHLRGNQPTVLDPMAGQGFLLANLAYRGFRVWVGDINPALCLLATLRSPKMVQNREKLVNWVADGLGKVAVPSAREFKLEYVDYWVPTGIKAQLQSYREAFDLAVDPFTTSAFWRMPLRKRFAAALPLLAARDITCFRSSDNLTWIKPGGLQREFQIVNPIKRALAAWLKYAEDKANELGPFRNHGELLVEKMDSRTGNFGLSPKADAIITSPPYANRLDYTRMWGPESQLAAAIWESNIDDIQLRQIGSNLVRGLKCIDQHDEELPRQIADALMAIRDDADYASESYYYPFFKNYAVSLMDAIRKMSARLKANGVLVIFVRDTVRKDVLFPAGVLVEEVLRRAGFRTVGKERRIVKQHVGLRRRGATSGLYGVGQQEWWLAFRRSRP